MGGCCLCNVTPVLSGCGWIDGGGREGGREGGCTYNSKSHMCMNT